MKIDFHSHVKLAKKLPYSQAYVEWMFTEAELAGIDAVCVTEHYTSLELGKLFDYFSTLETSGDALLYGNIKLFAGLEVDVLEGGHTLAIGPFQDIKALYDELQPYIADGVHPPLADVFAMVAKGDILYGAAHPFRKKSNLHSLPVEVLRNFHFLDLNGKDVANGGKLAIEQMEDLAHILGLPLVAGSDTHQATQYGCIVNEFDREVSTISEIRAVFADSAYRITHSPTAVGQVRAANTIKKALKEIHALDGDYVSVLAG